MSKKEFATIAVGIKAAYPQSEVMPDNASLEFWYKMLGDIDYTVLQNAVLEHIGTSAFVPRISELRQKCMERMNPMITDWGEAWEEVQLAIRRYGSYREVEAMESLSKLTAVAVRRLGFRNLCMSENIVADRAHFQRIYEGMVKEQKRQLQLPQSVRDERTQMIESHTEVIPQVAEKKMIVDERANITPQQYERRSKQLEELKKNVLNKI